MAVETITLNSMSGGSSVAVDTVASTSYQLMKIALGTDGSFDLMLDSGQQAMSASLPVVLSSDHSDIKITLDSETVALAAGDLNIGNVDIVTLPSGNLGQQTMSASLSTVPASDITDATYIGDIKFGESLPSGTNAIGKLSANSGIDIGDVDITSIIPSTGATNLGKAVDSVAGATDTGVALLAIRDDSLTSLTPVEGDYVNLRVNSTGALHVTGAGGGTQYAVDDLVGGTDTGTTMLVVRDDSLTTLTPADGDYTLLRVSSTGALHVTGGGGGTEYTEDVATADPIVGTATVMERDDALATLTPIESDWAAMRCSAEGALWVQDFNSDAILTSVQLIDDAISGSEMQVDVVAALPTGTNTIGSVKITDGTETVSINASNYLEVAITQDDVGIGGGTQYTVDTALGATPTGTLAIAIRDDALSALTPVEGDAIGLRVDANGALWTHDGALDASLSGSELQVDIVAALPTGSNAIGKLTANSGVDIGDVDVLSLPNVTIGTMANLTESLVDNTTFTPATSRVIPIGFEFDDTTPDSIDEGDIGAARMSANRNIYTTLRDAAGNERGVNINASNQLTVSVDNTVTVGSHAVTNTGTFVVQEDGAVLTALQLIDNFISGSRGLVTEDNSAAIKTAVELIDDVIFVDDTATHTATTTKGMGIMAVATPTDGSVDANDIAMPAMSLDRRLHTDTQIVGQDADITIADGGNAITVDWAGTAPPIGAGTEVGALRVTIANDSTGVLSIDDNGGTLTVDGTFWQATQPVSGTVTVDAGTNLNTSALALDANWVADDGALGKGILIQGDDGTDRKNINVDATTGDVQVDVTNTVTVDGSGVTQPVSGTFWQATQPVSIAATVTVDLGANNDVTATGNVAHDAADSGSPIKMGGRAQDIIGVEPEEVADNDRVDALFDQNGRLGVTAGSDYKYADINDAVSGDNTIVAAQAAGKRIAVWAILIVSDGTTDVRWEDGAAGTAFTGQVPLQVREGYSISSGGLVPLFVGTAATLLNLELTAAVNVHGFVSYTVIDD